MLSPYSLRLLREIERHGGTVEKFIGDAGMAVFGAPVAHEDDPERAGWRSSGASSLRRRSLPRLGTSAASAPPVPAPLRADTRGLGMTGRFARLAFLDPLSARL